MIYYLILIKGEGEGEFWMGSASSVCTWACSHWGTCLALLRKTIEAWFPYDCCNRCDCYRIAEKRSATVQEYLLVLVHNQRTESFNGCIYSSSNLFYNITLSILIPFWIKALTLVAYTFHAVQLQQYCGYILESLNLIVFHSLKI